MSSFSSSSQIDAVLGRHFGLGTDIGIGLFFAVLSSTKNIVFAKHYH
jgi:hypothetical protein